MKKAMVIAGLLIGFFGLTVQIHATPQDSGYDVPQKVSKTAQKAAVHASVHYQGAPHFARIEGTYIAFATNTWHYLSLEAKPLTREPSRAAICLSRPVSGLLD